MYGTIIYVSVQVVTDKYTQHMCCLCPLYRFIYVSVQVVTDKYTQHMCCLCPLYRFMKTPDRLSALRNARDTIRKRDRKIAKIKVRLKSLTSKRGIAVESDVRRKLLK